MSNTDNVLLILCKVDWRMELRVEEGLLLKLIDTAKNCLLGFFLEVENYVQIMILEKGIGVKPIIKSLNQIKSFFKKHNF